MAKRWPNWRRVKVHYNYTVEEAAELLGKHKNTIREWIKQGLAVIDRQRPHLILGRDMADFVRTRGNRVRQRCGPDQMFCLRCKAPKRPAGTMAEYIQISANLGNLRAICPDCSGLMHRRVNRRGLEEMMRFVDVTIAPAARRLIDRVGASEICDLKKG